MGSGRPSGPPVDPRNIDWWCHTGLPQMLSWVRDAFPKSKIVYRTIPTMDNIPSGGRSPEALATMNRCLSSELRGKFDAIDYRSIVQGMLNAGLPSHELFPDGIHPILAAAVLDANAAM